MAAEKGDGRMSWGPSERVLGQIAREYALGGEPSCTARPHRGELGQVRRLETSSGTWALKEIFEPEHEGDAAASASLQEAAVAAGVPAPTVGRTADGRVLLDADRRQFRVYAWVDVLPPDLHLDPVRVGALPASIHGLERSGPGPVLPWYAEPVGTGT